jgi:ABC-type lipoprotein export system ATPase subunit
MVIFADEPTSNLDTETAEAMFNLIKDINKNGATVIFTTHDPRIARLAGNVITMRDGKIQGEFKWNTIGVEP